ncbi:hypothetical protein GALMADRAFT_1255620 [Galerina marginata CBS 339.88]|uniref:Uncharacterized protein n=1 Tax=Galerina marginata (strain CBS 339.88) TaxID=685588 RepID=A0A067T5U5_GALM3|nr:hypothetical protein GALMADRAFT_1255620 [Galerina marginata CBS 339.88]
MRPGERAIGGCGFVVETTLYDVLGRIDLRIPRYLLRSPFLVLYVVDSAGRVHLLACCGMSRCWLTGWWFGSIVFSLFPSHVVTLRKKSFSFDSLFMLRPLFVFLCHLVYIFQSS